MRNLSIPPAIAKIAPDGNLTHRQKRHFMINMLLRRTKSGTGSSFEFIKRRTATTPLPYNLQIVLKNIKWVFIGDIATRAYMPERMTKDLDILVHKKDSEATIKALEKANYKLISQLAIPGVAMQSPDGIELDVLFGEYSWLDEAFKNTKQDNAGYPVIGLPYLVLLKMSAQRTQDWADVSRMLGWAKDTDLDEVRKVVKKYTPEDLEDLESLIFIGKKEKE